MDYLTNASVSPEKIAWLETFVPRKIGSALDLGCGAGLYSTWLTDRGWKVQAMDLNPSSNIRSAVILQHDLEKGLPFPSESFDLVLAWDILEHLTNEKQMWTEIGRTLRPGGVLIGSVPHNADQRLQRYNLTFKHHIDKTHRREYSPKGLQERIQNSKLNPLQVELKGPVSPQVFAEFVFIKSLRRPVARLIGAARRLGLLAFGELYADIFFAAKKPSAAP